MSLPKKISKLITLMKPAEYDLFHGEEEENVPAIEGDRAQSQVS